MAEPEHTRNGQYRQVSLSQLERRIVLVDGSATRHPTPSRTRRWNRGSCEHAGEREVLPASPSAGPSSHDGSRTPRSPSTTPAVCRTGPNCRSVLLTFACPAFLLILP